MKAMNNMKTTIVSSILFLGIIALFSGCYTQVGTTPESNQYQPSTSIDNDLAGAPPDSNGYNDYHDSDDWQHSHVGYSYYYPPSSTYWPSDYYATAYASPWSFGIGFGYGGGYYPYYGYGYGGYYGGYYPYYPYYGYPYYGYCSPYYYPSQNVRTYGSTRSGAPIRTAAYGRSDASPTSIQGASSDIYGRIPTGVVTSGGASQQLKRTSNTNTVPRTLGTSRVGRPNQANASRNASQRYQGSRGSMSRGGVARNAQRYQPGPSQDPRGKARSSVPENGGRSFSSPGRYSAPPPSGGGFHSAPAPSAGRGGGGGRRP